MLFTYEFTRTRTLIVTPSQSIKTSNYKIKLQNLSKDYLHSFVRPAEEI